MTDKIMRPIRQTEMDYWNFTIDSEYDNRKNSLKSEMVDEINDIADTNYPKFMKALKVDKLTKDIDKLYKDYHKFKSEKELIEQEKKRSLDKAVNALSIQLEKWNKVRKWKIDGHFQHGELEKPDQHDQLFKRLCHEETERAYYASPKGRALKLLEISAKRCKHSLNAGLPLDTAVSVIHQEMKSQKINLDLPKNVFNPLMLENK
jgi:DNA-binding transcriptional regulator GbsR (MarR family)